MRFRGDFGGSASCHDTDKGELVANIKTRVQKVFFFFCINIGNFVNNTKHCWPKAVCVLPTTYYVFIFYLCT